MDTRLCPTSHPNILVCLQKSTCRQKHWNKTYSTRCGLMTPYDDKNAGQSYRIYHKTSSMKWLRVFHRKTQYAHEKNKTKGIPLFTLVHSFFLICSRAPDLIACTVSRKGLGSGVGWGLGDGWWAAVILASKLRGKVAPARDYPRFKLSYPYKQEMLFVILLLQRPVASSSHNAVRQDAQELF